MLKLSLAAAVALPVIACAQVQTEVQQRQSEMLNPTVRVELEQGSGSGTVIHSSSKGTFLLTNHHVAGEKGAKVQVRFWLLNDNSETVLSVLRDAEVVASDADRDLALLRLVDSEFRAEAVARIAPERTRLHPGEDVWVAGAALGLRAHLTQGLLSLVAHSVMKRDHMVTSAPVVPGNSGGGVYHRGADGRFYYIGTVRAVALVGFGSVVPTTNYAIPNSSLREFLKANDFGWLV